MAVRANGLNGRDWLRSSFSIWRDFPRDGNRKAHPASFPVALVEKILACYARADALVLDPYRRIRIDIAGRNKRRDACKKALR